jgi:branched-chain amino acid transport system substrate-binding protein
MLRRRASGLLAALAVLAGCATQGIGPYGTGPAQAPEPGGGVASSHAVAALLPLSGPNAQLGQAMLKAAQLALSGPGAPALDPRDTSSTAAGASSAAQAALAAGDGLIVGPLTAAETAAVAAIARPAGVPVLAFTSDPAQAQPGIWTMGLTPLQQVRRLVGANIVEGKTRFAAVLSRDALGDALAQALTQTLASQNQPAPTIARYNPGFSDLNTSLHDLSDYADRRGPIEAQLRQLRTQTTPDAQTQAADLSQQPIPPPPFDVLLLSATSTSQLNAILPQLRYYDIGPHDVRVIGPALWAGVGGRVPGLSGAWYAAPQPDARQAFVDSYQSRYGGPPPPLADLAFDAAAIARVVASTGSYSYGALARPDGFVGADGVIGLLPDGHVRRGLAVFELDAGGFHMVEPAPASLSAPGI